MPRFRPFSIAVTALMAVMTVSGSATADDGSPEWSLPVPGASILVPFDAPAHDYAAGHRGIDIGPVDGPVLSPADGVVAFAGTVVDRGVVTIDHGGGWVTSVEPVLPSVTVGEVIAAGDRIGTIAAGGHAPPGAVHVGVRREGRYVNPLLLLGRVPRAVLLPCC
ncbi:murein hydrolase activator EnvC family protein [Microbacterium sp. NPDC091382]|uniref:murein hydrolase activator EnvC family protein n=1 Tax=Microbacterium sp. NPDC091382 TaxID=3364210 RepID=UPI0037F7DD10